jgi:hypothetical protein
MAGYNVERDGFSEGLIFVDDPMAGVRKSIPIVATTE